MSEHLETELAHYRERWRATERIVDQRLTMLLAVLASAVAATVALLSREVRSPTVSLDTLLGGVWAALAIISQGIFLRLVRARASIHRNVATINFLRCYLMADLPGREKAALEAVYSIDSSLPRAFYLWGSCSSAALVQGVSVILAGIFLMASLELTGVALSVALGLAAFAANIAHYRRRCQRISYAALERK